MPGSNLDNLLTAASLRRYQEGGNVGRQSKVDLEGIAASNEDFIRKWVRQRPTVTGSYEDLIGAIQGGKLTAQEYPQDEWGKITQSAGIGSSPAAFLSGRYTGEGPDAEFLSGDIKYPTGGESSIPHELLHYFASHKPGSAGTPKTINPYIKLDMALKGWLPSLHPAGRRPRVPGKTKLGQWWNKKFATKQAPYSDKSGYHPWFDEDAFDRIGAEYGEFEEQFRTGEDFKSGKRFIDNLAQNPVAEETKPTVPQPTSEMPVSFDKNNYPVYNKKSNKAQSFRDAFREARRDGEGTFSWDGRLYTSELK